MDNEHDRDFYSAVLEIGMETQTAHFKHFQSPNGKANEVSEYFNLLQRFGHWWAWHQEDRSPANQNSLNYLNPILN